MKSKKIWFLSGLGVAAGAVLLIMVIGSRQESIEQLYGLDLPDSSELSARGTPDTQPLNPQVSELAEQEQRQTQSITRPESVVLRDPVDTAPASGAEPQSAGSTPPALPATIEAAQVLDEQPPPAAGQAGTAASTENTPRQAATGVTPTPITLPRPVSLPRPDKFVSGVPASATPDTGPAAAGLSDAPLQTTASAAFVTEEGPVLVTQQQASVSTATGGPWVINLTSTQSKAEAERFAQRALAQDIQTELQQATVNGTQYWRVQITGFATKAEAMASTGSAKDALGLKDVWITTR